MILLKKTHLEMQQRLIQLEIISYLARSQFDREDVALVGYLEDLWPSEAIDSQSFLVNQ